MRFFKKIQDHILKSKRIWKWTLLVFTKQINPRSFGLWCVKGTEESTSRVDSALVPLTHHDLRDLGLICLVKKCKICFQILSDLRIQSWIFSFLPANCWSLMCVIIMPANNWLKVYPSRKWEPFSQLPNINQNFNWCEVKLRKVISTYTNSKWGKVRHSRNC